MADDENESKLLPQDEFTESMLKAPALPQFKDNEATFRSLDIEGDDAVASALWTKTSAIYTFQQGSVIRTNFRPPVRALWRVRVGFHRANWTVIGYTQVTTWEWSLPANHLIQSSFLGKAPAGTRYMMGMWWRFNAANQVIAGYYNNNDV